MGEKEAVAMLRDPGCTRCTLHTFAENRCVWGRQVGVTREKEVMIVGLAPGAQEDALGKPFIGPSGELLAGALAQAGVTDYYLTNAVKCFPGTDSSVVEPAHIKACAPYLEEEIAGIRPRIILALGAVALKALHESGSITDRAGKEVWSERYGAYVLPALHPAAVLRARGKYPSWAADIGRVAGLLSGELGTHASPPVEVHRIESPEDLRGLTRILSWEPFISYDFESNIPDENLDFPAPMFHQNWRPYSIAFSVDGRTAWTVPLCHPEVDADWRRIALAWLKSVLAERLMTPQAGALWLAHNEMFDALALYRSTGVQPTGKVFDTMMALHLLDENQPKGLKWASRAYLGWPDYDIDARGIKIGKVWTPHPLDRLARYNGYDAAATWNLWWKLDQELRANPVLWNYWNRLEMPKLRALERMVARGVHIDLPLLDAQERGAVVRQTRADEALQAASEGAVLNPGSASQVAQWFYAVKKLPVLKTGKTHGSTDEETINRLALLGHEEAKLVLDCRRPRKEISTYYEPIRYVVSHTTDGRYHPDIRTARVETGRLSSFFHTLPRPIDSVIRGEPPVKQIVSAPAGSTLLQADYRQIEARLAAWSAAGRPETWEEVSPALGNMLRAFRNGRDIYAEQAAHNVYGDASKWREITKLDRQNMGKVPVLAMLYRIGPKGLQEYAWKGFQLNWTLAQTVRIWRGFHEMWPEFSRWHDLEEAKLRARGYAQSPIGRLRRLPEAQGGDINAILSGINSPVQSMASDITQQALVMLDHIWQRPEVSLIGRGPVGDIHDALLIEAFTDKVETAARLLRLCMLQAPAELRPLGLRLPEGLIEVEITVGPWGAGKEWKEL